MADAGMRFDPARRLPWPHIPHVAIAGRSNVGKSTLLNKLMGSKLARVSRTPGRTRAIYMHEWYDRRTETPTAIIADLPGFGHAKVGHELRELWQQWAMSYFAPDGPVSAAMLCLDAKLPLQSVDLEFVAWLGGSAVRELLIVGTKSDRLNQRERYAAEGHLEELQANAPISMVANIALISVEKGDALQQVESWLRRVSTSR